MANKPMKICLFITTEMQIKINEILLHTNSIRKARIKKIENTDYRQSCETTGSLPYQ